jgi:hypothetical protein
MVSGPGQAMEFNVSFDTYVGVAPGPTPPIVGTGVFGFDENLGDGSHLFSTLTNVYMSYEFIPAPPSFPDPSFFYNFYDLPNPVPPDPANPFPYTNFDYLYDPSLKVVIYDNGRQFYFDGPSIPNYNVGALDLNMKQSYIDLYHPGQSPIYLSFQPNNTPIPPGGSPILPPYNRYGIYANTDVDPNTPPELIVNGIYGTIVPGPLPIIGVGAAFGLSRRLRQRVKATRTTPNS